MVNEESNRVVDANFNSKIVGKTYIQERDQTLIFTENDDLYLFDHGKETSIFVMNPSEFGCPEFNLGGCEYHYAELKNMGSCNEIHAYFSSKCKYYVVNIDEMLDPKRKEALKQCIKKEPTCGQCNSLDCSYFDLFKCVCAPKVSAIPSTKGGYGLLSGSYQFAVQLEDNAKNTTNWFWVSNPISIGSENNIGGEVPQRS